MFAGFIWKVKTLNEKPTYFKLFARTFSISALAIGGGYVMIPMLREQFADKLGWIDKNELTELTAIGQSAPGAMIVNVSVLMGYRLLGFWGAVCALLGTALPAVVLLIAAYYLYDIIRDNKYVSAGFRGMSAGVSAVIADTVVTMALPFIKKSELLYALIMVGAFAAAWFFGLNVALVIVICGIVGIIIGVLRDRRKAS